MGLLKIILKFFSKLRIQILVLGLIGWGVALAIDRTLVEDYRNKSDDIFTNVNNYQMVRTKRENAAFIILSIFETGLFGLGIGFFVSLGFRVFKIKNKMLRKRMIWCWAAISYFCVTWWPHSTSHFLILTTGRSPIDNYITMETTFHWTLTFCSSTLAYFQYDLIQLMRDVAIMRKKMVSNGKEEVDPLKREWYRNYHYHSIVIAIVVLAIAIPIAFHFDPLTNKLERYQRFFYVTFHIVNSAVAAVGFAFAYAVTRTILLLPPSPGRKVSIISSIAITFLFIIQYIHPMVHVKTEPSMKNTIAIDFGFHVPIVFATGILAFYQFRLMELATDDKSALSIAVRMRSDSKSASKGSSLKTADNASQSQSSNSFSTSIQIDQLKTKTPPTTTTIDESNNNNNNENSIEMKDLENNPKDNNISICIEKE
ncbi:hypothetical protein ACTFIZ_001722 [Dictyostelium cf. discoideum]